MADAETKPLDEKAQRAAAIKAWHDATTDAEKKAVVAQYPVLVSIYSTAQNFK